MIKTLLLPLASLLSACVALSPAGAQVQVFRAEQTDALSACEWLGQVSVSSEDALRNAAAALSGDAALMVPQEINGSVYIRGSVYRCAPGAAASAAPPLAVTAPSGETETARKAAKCREKGGHWSRGLCVIDVD